MQAQLKQLAKLNADLRRKNNNTQRQARNLIEERTDLETQLQEKEQQISQIKEKLMNQDSLESPESPSGYFPVSGRNVPFLTRVPNKTYWVDL